MPSEVLCSLTLPSQLGNLVMATWKDGAVQGRGSQHTCIGGNMWGTIERIARKTWMEQKWYCYLHVFFFFKLCFSKVSEREIQMPTQEEWGFLERLLMRSFVSPLIALGR